MATIGGAVRKAMGPMKTAVDSEGRVVLLREFAPDPPTSVKAAETFAQWVRLPEHPALLRAVQVSERGVLVRYAALARELWREETPQLARLGAVLADVYATISPVVTDTARLAWPFVQIDAAGQIRIGFNPIDEHTTKLPPIVTSTFPRCDERTLVYVVGEIVADHVYHATDSTLARVIDRCRARKPHKRYQTLREAAEAFRALVPDDRPPTMEDHVVWTRIEQAMGWGELGHAERVIEICEPYRTHPRYGSVAIACEQLARSALERNRVVLSRPAPEVSVAWPEVEAEGARLEAAGHLVAALQLYVCFAASPPRGTRVRAYTSRSASTNGRSSVRGARSPPMRPSRARGSSP
jgi:hypothetical protein